MSLIKGPTVTALALNMRTTLRRVIFKSSQGERGSPALPHIHVRGGPLMSPHLSQELQRLDGAFELPQVFWMTLNSRFILV